MWWSTRREDVHRCCVGTILLAALFVSQSLCAQGAPEITSTVYIPLGHHGGVPRTAVTQVGPRSDGRWGKYQVVATVITRDRGDFFVLTTVDAIVAPRVLPDELRNRDLTKEVGWGVVASSRNLESQVLQGVRPLNRKPVQAFVLDVDRLLLDSFSDQNETLWPWAVRTTVRILNRDGNILASDRAVLQITPKTQ
jgi:hypothetical protein